MLQERKVKPVGANKEEAIDVRIIAATNKNLAKEIALGNFREDLFYRVAVGVLNLPPLNKRTGDLLILSQHLLNDINKKATTQPSYINKALSIKAQNLILKHTWHGNIRELYSTLLRASLWATTDKITDSDLQEAMFEPVKEEENIFTKKFESNFNIHKVTDDLRALYIKKALKESNNSITKSAELLGLNNYQTLTGWIKKMNIELSQD